MIINDNHHDHTYINFELEGPPAIRTMFKRTILFMKCSLMVCVFFQEWGADISIVRLLKCFQIGTRGHKRTPLRKQVLLLLHFYPSTTQIPPFDYPTIPRTDKPPTLESLTTTTDHFTQLYHHQQQLCTSQVPEPLHPQHNHIHQPKEWCVCFLKSVAWFVDDMAKEIKWLLWARLDNL